MGVHLLRNVGDSLFNSIFEPLDCCPDEAVWEPLVGGLGTKHPQTVLWSRAPAEAVLLI